MRHARLWLWYVAGLPGLVLLFRRLRAAWAGPPGGTPRPHRRHGRRRDRSGGQAGPLTAAGVTSAYGTGNIGMYMPVFLAGTCALLTAAVGLRRWRPARFAAIDHRRGDCRCWARRPVQPDHHRPVTDSGTSQPAVVVESATLVKETDSVALPKWRVYQDEAARLFSGLGFSTAVDETVHGVRGSHAVDVVARSSRAGLSQVWMSANAGTDR